MADRTLVKRDLVMELAVPTPLWFLRAHYYSAAAGPHSGSHLAVYTVSLFASVTGDTANRVTILVTNFSFSNDYY